MAKGIIYVMSTIVPGLVKIGKTGLDNFESRMYSLERNGYSNVTGLKRKFAIEVEDYDEKEQLLDEIFSKSRIINTELFALDIDLVVQLLSSFEGKQIYPKDESKEQVFVNVTHHRKEAFDRKKIPDGIYYMSQNKKGFGKVKGTMRVEGGKFIVEKGSICTPFNGTWAPKARKSAVVKDHILQEDVICDSPSIAGYVIIGHSVNGWTVWKNKDNKTLEIYRSKQEI
ncbi:DUF4357 domain-containing protein [uncultured Dubosiella sp.]|jgi:hypothetical protein|uniref:DUF4357 domain-containing protein n=1 Tax=uncultured Dubosiella sp. TaxID=1937011 RepID=UPI00207F3C46|nr:DUF4357 domain-containing protein [uncultured Dubosiella sp.]GJM59206.1 hypothetical protein EROP_28990 [Erysipelotrichaceae bacterium OPF54]